MSPGIGHNGGPPAGYLIIDRGMAAHPIFGAGRGYNTKTGRFSSKIPFSWNEAAQDIVGMAAFASHEKVNKGERITLQRGELMASRSFLAKRWRWSEKAVRTFQKHAINSGFIEVKLRQSYGTNRGQRKGQEKGQEKGQQRSNQISILSVCNYERYQNPDYYIEMRKGQQGDQVKGQAKGQPRASEGPEDNTGNTNTKTTNSGVNITARDAPDDFQSPEQQMADALTGCHEFDVGMDENACLEVYNGYEAELKSQCAESGINLEAFLKRASGVIGPGMTQTKMKQKINRELGIVIQDEMGKTRRYNQAVKRNQKSFRQQDQDAMQAAQKGGLTKIRE